MRTPTRIAPATNRGTSAVSLAWFLTSIKGTTARVDCWSSLMADADAVLHIVGFTCEQLSLNRFVLARHADVIMLAGTIKAPVRLADRDCSSCDTMAISEKATATVQTSTNSSGLA